MCFLATPRAKYQQITGREYSNTIVEVGFTWSVGGLASTDSFSQALGVQFVLSTLDLEPLYHGYENECSEAQLTIRFW